MPESHADSVPLSAALRKFRREPLRVLRQWNWKAAALSAVLRGTMFLLLNMRAGHGKAERAMLVELAYGTVAAGVAGSVTQQLRHAVPVKRTALFVFLVLPLALLPGQAVVHSLLGTPRLLSGLLLSLIFASLASGFNWWAMRNGLFLTGCGRGLIADLLLGLHLLARNAEHCRLRYRSGGCGHLS